MGHKSPKTPGRGYPSLNSSEYSPTSALVILTDGISERKIERVEKRLAGIEEMLSNLTSLTRSLSLGGTPRQVPTAAAVPSYASPTVEPGTAYEALSIDEEHDETFEGNSSMTAHTAFASEFLEQAVTSPSFNQKLSPDIQNALACLRQMVQLQSRRGVTHESRLAHQKPVPRGLSQLPLPPTDSVLKLLREIKGQWTLPALMT
jgi:hypothetical protein